MTMSVEEISCLIPETIAERRSDINDRMSQLALIAPVLRPSSVALYVSRIGLLREAMERRRNRSFAKGDFSWAFRFSDVQKVLKHEWDKEDSWKIWKTTCAAIRRLISQEISKEAKQAYLQYAKWFEELQQLKDKEDLTQALSERERKNWVDWDIIVSGVDRLLSRVPKGPWDPTDYETFRRGHDALILGLMGRTKIVRRNEIRLIKLRGFDPIKDNYVDMIQRTVVFNQFKTSTSFDKQTIEVTDNEVWDLLKMVSSWSDRRTYLFTNTEELPFHNSSAFTTYLSRLCDRVLGSPLTVNMFRKSFATWSNEGKPLLLDQDERARAVLTQTMAHSSGTHEKYRRNTKETRSRAELVAEMMRESGDGVLRPMAAAAAIRR
jgi:hypothetical protein